jgi:hypothetical protein
MDELSDLNSRGQFPKQLFHNRRRTTLDILSQAYLESSQEKIGNVWKNLSQLKNVLRQS